MELRHVLEYVLAQKGLVADSLRRSLIEIACRATAGDQDLFRAVSAWKKTTDPKIRSMLMSGYVRSAVARVEDPLPEPEQVAEPLPEDVALAYPAAASTSKKLTFFEAKDELVEASVSPEILTSPIGAEIIATMREHGLLAALKCLRG